jgi:hypothetical protein
MRLSGARLLDVGEVVAKATLDEAELRLEGDQVFFAGVGFHIIPGFRQRAERLVKSASAAPPTSGS